MLTNSSRSSNDGDGSYQIVYANSNGSSRASSIVPRASRSGTISKIVSKGSAGRSDGLVPKRSSKSSTSYSLVSQGSSRKSKSAAPQRLQGSSASRVRAISHDGSGSRVLSLASAEQKRKDELAKKSKKNSIVLNRNSAFTDQQIRRGQTDSFDVIETGSVNTGTASYHQITPAVSVGMSRRTKIVGLCGMLLFFIGVVGGTIGFLFSGAILPPSQVPVAVQATPPPISWKTPTPAPVPDLPTPPATPSSPAPAPTVPTSTSPPFSEGGVVKKEIMDALSSVLDSAVLSEYFNNQNSPQYLALEWIIKQDPLKLQVEARKLRGNGISRIVHRFLVASLWFSFEGDNSWKESENWLSGQHECDWFGIVCRDIGGGMRSTEEIDLTGNNIRGEIPLHIPAFPHLETIKLGVNNIKGSIPSTFGKLTNLKHFEIYNNFFTGSIPASIGDMKLLENIFVSGNLLTDEIPEEIGLLTNLQDLQLYDNLLEGALPNSLSGLDNLERLWISYNDFSGTFPIAILGMNALNNLYLDNNKFEGPFPAKLPDRVPMLADMRLDHNEFTGCPSIKLFQMTELEVLYLDHNKLSCKLSPEIYEGPVLFDLQIHNNAFFGPIPRVNIQSPLRILDLEGNQFDGSIPKSFGNLINIEKLNLQRNKLYGSIPNELSSLTNLKSFSLNDNQFKGAIHSYFGDFTKLTHMAFHNNAFSGQIPNQISSLSSIQKLTFHQNSLTGSVPQELCPYRTNQLEMLTADCAGANAEITCSCCSLCAISQMAAASPRDGDGN